MRGIVLGWAAVVGFCVLGSAAARAEEKDILKQIQGTWRFTEHNMGGQTTSEDMLKNMTITFKGEKWTVRDGDQVVQAGTHKFDASKKPLQVDAKVTEGQNEGNTMLGICELKGDTLRVCFDPTGKERPTNFSAKGDHFLATVKRVKK